MVSPHADVVSDVDSGKSDVACRVSKILHGFHFKIVFVEMSLGTWLCF